MENQIEKKQYLPNIVSLIFSASLFLLMMLPHSQYELLNELSTQAGSAETLNMYVVLPAILTIFIIIVYCFVCMMSLLSLFMSYFYNFHFVSKGILFTSTIAFVLQSVYFFVGLNGVLENGERIISVGNIIVYILSLIFIVFFYYLYHIYIEIPYKRIKLEARKHVHEFKNDTPIYQEEKPIKENKNDLEMTVLNMLQKGKITADEARKMLEEIHEEEHQN